MLSKPDLALLGVLALMIGGTVFGLSLEEGSPEQTWQLPSGEAIGCRGARVTACGVTLERCGFEARQTFECQTNVRYVAPSGEGAE